MASKTPGKKMYLSRFGGERSIPEKFLSAMERSEEIQSGIANEDGPEELSDTVVESRMDTDRTNERVRHTVKKKSGNITLQEFRTGNNGEAIQVTLTLFPSDGAVAKPTSTQNINVENLGNGWSIQEIAVYGEFVSGVFVASSFHSIELAQERDDPIPQRFQVAAPRTQTQTVADGKVAPPTLTTNQLRVSERQLDVYKKLVSQLARIGLTLPIVLNSSRTNEQGQKVSVTETLQNTTTPPSASATKDVAVQDLGNGTQVLTVEDIPAIFQGVELSQRVEDPVPQRFRSRLPITQDQSIVAGTATAPTINPSVNDLEVSERQLTLYKKVVTEISRAGISLPITLLGKRTDEHGQLVSISETYRVIGTGPTPSATENVQVTQIDSTHEVVTLEDIPAIFANAIREASKEESLPLEFRASIPATLTSDIVAGLVSAPTLGTGDLQATQEQLTAFVKRVRTLSRTLPGTWPTLHGTDIDETIGVGEPYTLDIVDDGTAGGISGGLAKQIRPLGDGRALQKATTIPSSAWDSYSLVMPGRTSVNVPFELLTVVSVVNLQAGNGSYSETGTYTLVNNGSGGVSLRATCRASAAAMLDVAFTYKRVPEQIPCTHVLLLFPSGTTETAILARLTTIMGAAVLTWPKFTPKAATLVCMGGKAATDGILSAHASDSIDIDATGAVIKAGSIRTSGNGQSSDLGIDTKVLRLPETIHGNISVTGYGLGSSSVPAITASATGSISNGASSASVGPLTVGAGCVINPTGLTATGAGTVANPNTIPTNGLYLARMSPEPYKLGYFRVHCEVVSATDF
jgi:hypothetical protein